MCGLGFYFSLVAIAPGRMVGGQDEIDPDRWPGGGRLKTSKRWLSREVVRAGVGPTAVIILMVDEGRPAHTRTDRLRAVEDGVEFRVTGHLIGARAFGHHACPSLAQCQQK